MLLNILNKKIIYSFNSDITSGCVEGSTVSFETFELVSDSEKSLKFQEKKC